MSKLHAFSQAEFDYLPDKAELKMISEVLEKNN